MTIITEMSFRRYLRLGRVFTLTCNIDTELITAQSLPVEILIGPASKTPLHNVACHGCSVMFPPGDGDAAIPLSFMRHHLRKLFCK